MKLIRHGGEGHEDPGVMLDDGSLIDASGEFLDYDEAFFACGGLDSLKSWVDGGCIGGIRLDPETRLGAPVVRPSKLVCVGKNYADHAKEFGGEVPDEPVLFMKATTSCCGPFDDVVLPHGSTKLDYEVELALVVGRTASNVHEADALDYLAGYTVMCDYSERKWQKEHCGQWMKGKSADTFAPMGPCLVTTDELKNPQSLCLWTKVNGEKRQNGWSGDMMFPVAFLVSYISKFMTLLPGDVIATGTPAGVGMGMVPPRYLSAGDYVELGIEGIGHIRQRVIPSV
ncbi:fumarylacetoacetate hydrolase family protein [Verrucomicrobiaceae bacterium R5-34]|uniref:Fumarylacetoacetate hydrolase family protein n=1 Tax=Oceaniferula flava TaxID=2800421 RepID=A0AAE2VF06_9BACT|nr:fumarylacetoacetate hydrolase family protein [Oceaniferula flavus]MBK1830807.1 fumarylacetoacetate hydrolase family protein [Verrucomicrobiaceae bacterium R5-34]MBK1856454.1 fumarylacetoacetate hydrolase family protein [Oceaniferula flavus]MBM1137761.1 fumarylacetoacetate hydrolase family protein [Oceaniferula flavus]